MSIYYVAGVPYSDELYHWGIKGQKWGIRRYQNEDGTLTEAGKKRYNTNSGNSTSQNAKNVTSSDDKNEKIKKAAKIAAIAAAAGLTAYGMYKLGKSGAFNDFIADQKARVGMIKDAAKVRRMTFPQLEEKAALLQKQVDVMRLTRESLSSSGDPSRDMAIKAGQKVISSALAGVGAYVGYSLVSNTINKQKAADYIFSNPNSKKK